MKKQINVQVEVTGCPEDLDFKTLEEADEILKLMLEKYGKDARILLKSSGYENYEMYINYSREETTMEYEERLEKEAYETEKKTRASLKKQQALLKKREKEKAEYERLKAIYGEKQ